jgi:hypothetical protein
LPLSHHSTDVAEIAAMNCVTDSEKAHFCAMLGSAVVRVWSKLPAGVQEQLFEEAASHGETFRQQLAVFLHDHHSRTTDALKAHVMAEPDSLGG